MCKIHTPELFKPKQNSLVKRYAKYILKAKGVDPAIIAVDLGLQLVTVQMIQRKLGLRNCVAAGRKRNA